MGPLLISGASGFVGANLVRFFLARGVELIALEGPSHCSWRLEGLPGLKRREVDLGSRAEIEKLVADTQPSAFINCAAFGAYSMQTEVDRIYAVNFDSVRYLFEALRKVEGFRAFIQTGSSSEYGANCTAPREDAQTLPDSHYAVSKVAANALVSYYGAKLGLPAWNFRLYSVYGPWEDGSRLVPRLLREAHHKKLPPLVDPRISRDFIHVDDVARACAQLIARAGELKRGEAFNIGTGTRVRLEDIVAVTRRLFGVGQEPAWASMPARKWDHADWYSNPEKAEREFGWKAAISLEEGLRMTMEWMLANHKAAFHDALLYSVSKETRESIDGPEKKSA